MSSPTQELSLLEGRGPITYVNVIDTLRSLAHRCKRSINVDELNEIIYDVELIETACEDIRTRELLKGSSTIMRQRLKDYEEPIMVEFANILSEIDKLNPLKMVVLLTLTNIASVMVLAGEVVDDPQLMVGTGVPDKAAHYDLNAEMRLKCPKKRDIQCKLGSLSYNEFREKWNLIKIVIYYRRDSINPIWKLSANMDQNPGQIWNLTPEEVNDDIHYLWNFVYHTNDLRVIESRWEWDKKILTLHVKRLCKQGCDEHTITEKGRTLEIATRKLIFDLDII